MGAIWEKRPDESMRAYNAFVKYREMPPNERTYEKVAAQLGCSVQNITNWSGPSKHAWQERVYAYDEYNNNLRLAVRQSGEIEAVQATLEQEGVEIAALTHIANETLRVLVGDPKDLDMLYFTRLVAVIDRIQMMRRRNLGLPASYTTQTADEIKPEQPVYYARPEVVGLDAATQENNL